MQFRRSGQRDERRRRVLIEDSTARELDPGDPAGTGRGSDRGSAHEPHRRYPDALLAAHQARLVDLIPSRRWTVLVWFLGFATGLVGLEALYGYVALGYAGLDVHRLPAIDLAGPASISQWFCAILLLLSAGFGILTYLIRRHRVDDYRGRYRMWYWVVPLLLLASLDRVAGLQSSVRTAVLELAGIPTFGDALLIWTAAFGLVLGALSVRVAIELRGCRLSVSSLILSIACLATVAVARAGWLWPHATVLRAMAVSTLTMTGHLMLWLAFCLYARYVCRDAAGEISVRPRKRRKSTASPTSPQATPDAARKRNKKLRTDAAHSMAATREARGPDERQSGPVRPGRKRKVAVPVEAASAPEPAGAQAEPGASERKLSKAERRRLRKQRRRERQGSEQQ